MRLIEYKSCKEELYSDFANYVKEKIELIISQANLNTRYEYNLLHVQARAKTYESLEKKLQMRNKVDANNIEEVINDIAGCRVIFYHNDDVSYFIQSNIIGEAFKVDWKKTKIHGPGLNPVAANDFYTANHYVITLLDNNSDSELIRFKGLKCEIQIHTMLNHAWSEIAHNITYKTEKTPSFGEGKFESIDKRLKKIMEQHLIPAGVEFQKVKYDYQRLLEGKELFDCDIKQKIIECSDNNERYDILEKYLKCTLPQIDHNYIMNNIVEILNLIKVSISCSRGVDPSVIYTLMGNLEGKKFKEILFLCLEILNFVRYVDVNLTFDFFIELLALSWKVEEEKMIYEFIDKLIQYDFNTLKTHGFYVQNIVLMRLELLDNITIYQIRKLVIRVCCSILTPTIESVSIGFKESKICRGVIPGNTKTSDIRQGVLRLIKKTYKILSLEQERYYLIEAFFMSTYIPTMSVIDYELVTIILNNTRELIEFYNDYPIHEDYKILKIVERKFFFLYRQTKGIVSGPWSENTNCLQAGKRIIDSINIFRGIVNGNEKFVIYKTMIGAYDSVFDGFWDDENLSLNIERQENYRNEKLNEYAENIFQKGENFWEEMILMCANVQNDYMIFFGKFLNFLSEENPDFIMKLLQQHEEKLSHFLIAILTGLLKKSPDQAKELMKKFVSDEKHIFYCAGAYEYYKPIDIDLVKDMFNKAKNSNDIGSMINVMIAVIKNYKEHPCLIIEIFLQAIVEFTRLNTCRWIDAFWFRSESEDVLSSLDDAQIDIILDNFVLTAKIDFHAENLLLPIANYNPEKILVFFRKRFSYKKAHQLAVDAYDPIPFDFEKLNEPLSRFPALIISSILLWHDDDQVAFTYCGSRFIRIIFPSFLPELEEELIALINTNPTEKIFSITVSILRHYLESTDTYNVLKMIVKKCAEDKKIISDVKDIMMSNGLRHGFDGQKIAYAEKIELITPWLKDESEMVKIFANEMLSILNSAIISETRRVREDIEFLKHQFNEDEFN